MSTLEVKAIQAPSGYDLDMPAGAVLQVIEGTTTTDTSTSATVFTATSLSADITPKFSSSKILITVNGHLYSPSGNQFSCDVYRGNASITGKTEGFQKGWYSDTRGRFPVHCCLLDSPNTTSSTTYKLYIKSASSSNSIGFPNQPTETKCTITLMEIAG